MPLLYSVIPSLLKFPLTTFYCYPTSRLEYAFKICTNGIKPNCQDTQWLKMAVGKE